MSDKESSNNFISLIFGIIAVILFIFVALMSLSNPKPDINRLRRAYDGLGEDIEE